MASLRLIPYAYVPTKRRPRNNDQRSSVDKHPGAHHITQQSKLGVLPEKALQSSTAERPGDTRRASDSVHATTADELVGQRTQNLASISSAEVFSNGDTADQDTLGREGGYSQVQFTENNAIYIDPSSDFDSVFGDINALFEDALFEEQEVSPMIEYGDSYATNLHPDASTGQTNGFASGNEFAKTNTPSSSSCSSQLTKLGTCTKRRREEDNLSVVMNGSSSDSGISEESDNESIFEVRQSKRSKSGSPISSPNSSIYSSDVEEGVAKSGTSLSTHRPVPVADLIERKNKSTIIGTSNLIHDIDPQIDDGDLSDDGDDELCHSPSWYRFGPSPAKSDSDDNLPGFARPCYVAQVEDAYSDREFHNIIGKEYIDGEVHYMVDWVPTLVRGHVLRQAQAQPLIRSFEARCQSYKEGGKGHGNDRSNGYGATGGTQQRKRRGRPRN